MTIKTMINSSKLQLNDLLVQMNQYYEFGQNHSLEYLKNQIYMIKSYYENYLWFRSLELEYYP